MTDPNGRIAILVHEIRSPVAALAVIADAFADADSPGRRELARLCLAACSAAERLVTDITIASIRSTDVDLGALVRDSATAFTLAGNAVEVDLDEPVPHVQGDPVRLRQVIDNLLTNATVHAPAPEPGSEPIHVRIRSTSKEVAVSVIDTGPGIASEVLDRIFEPGVRLDESRRGSGLGLAITRAIVDAHEGSLSVESVPGHGTTFTVSLPRGDVDQPET